MKKLITMIAAVASAFGLYATPVDITPHTFNPSDASVGKYDISGDEHWGYLPGPQADDALVITDAKKLEIKTGSNALKRYFVDATDTAKIPDGALYFESEINFKGQALDEVPEVEDGKLAIFALDASQIEGINPVLATTNLYIIGGFGASGKALYQLNEPVTEEFLSSAHKVTLKIYPAALNETGRAGFLLFIDGDAAAAKAAIPVAASFMYEPDKDGKFGATELNNPINVAEATNGYLGYMKSEFVPALQGWVKGYQFFLSLETAKVQDMASVDFMGNAILGALMLTDIAPEYIPDDAKAVTITTTLDYTVTVDGQTVTPDQDGRIIGADGDAVVITVTDNEKVQDKIVKYTATGLDVAQDGLVFTFDFAANGSIEITAVDIAAYVTVDGMTTPVASLEDAIDAVNNATAAGTLKLASDVTIDDDLEQMTFDGGDADLTLDLNGKIITGSSESRKSTVIWNKGKLTIIDSSDAKTGKIVPDEDNDYAVLNNGNATLAIEAGIFDGAIAQADEGTISISGGSFVGEATAFPYPTWLAARKVATYDGTKYWVVGDQPSAGFVIQLVGNVQQSGDDEAGYTFTAGEGNTVGSILVNGVEQDISGGAFWKPEAWYAEKQYVVVAAKQTVTIDPTAKKWYESLGAVASNKTMNVAGVGTNNDYGPNHGMLDEEIFTTTLGTAGKGLIMWKDVADLEAGEPSDIGLIKTQDMIKPGTEPVEYYYGHANDMRGVALSKKLGVMLTLDDDASGTLISFPIDASITSKADYVYEGANQNVFFYQAKYNDGAVTVCFDSAAFSADGKYLYTNGAHNDSTDSGNKNNYIWKWEVVNGLKGANGGLKLVDKLLVGKRIRAVTTAKIGGEDMVYGIVNGKDGIIAAKMTGTDAANWTFEQILTGDDIGIAGTYGTLTVSGLAAGTPHLVIAPSQNSNYDSAGAPFADKIMVYDIDSEHLLTKPSIHQVNGVDCVWDTAALEAAGFGHARHHCNTIAVSADETTMYFGRGVDAGPSGTADYGSQYVFVGKYTEYAKFILNDEKATDTSVTNMYRKAAVIAEAPAPAETENFKGWFTDSEKTVAAEFPLTLNADTELWAKYESEQPIVPVKPGEDIKPAPGTTIDDINNNDEVKALYLKAPGDITTTKAYRDLFKAVAGSAEGTVKFVLNTAGEAAVEAAEKAADTTVLAAALDASATAATVENPLTGFYYSLKQNADVTKLGFKADADKNLLGGKDTVTFTLEKNPTSEFYQMIVTPVPVE